MGCKLMEEVVPLIRERRIGGVGGGFWVERFIFVGAIQVYSDKPCQTLKAGSHTFLPLHLGTLSLTQAVRQSLVSNCGTVVAYLPVHIVMVETQEGGESFHPDDGECGDEDDYRAPTAGKKTSRRERRKSRQRLLQKAIEVALKPLWDVARVVFTVVDVDGDVRQCYPALVSYCADTPEASDIGCTLHSHCPRGYTARPTFASEERCVPCCPHDTLKVLGELEAAGSAAEVKSREESMQIVGIASIRPALLSWPFIELCASLALPKLLRFETLHNFFLGLSRSLKVSASEMLKDSSLLTTKLLNAKGSARKLKSARVDILKKCNAFLRRVNTDSPCVGLNFDFSKAGTNEVLSGLFTATGIAAMLEAKDLAGVDQVMPFVFALLDRLCGTTAATPRTTVCVLYQDMVATATSRFSEPGFTIAELEALFEKISEFKAKAIEVLGGINAAAWRYQSSMRCTTL
jgi:Plavaka transposase